MVALSWLGRRFAALLGRSPDADRGKADGYMDAANTYADQGQFQRAVKEYDKVLRSRPKYLDGYLNRGYAYFNLGDARRAVIDFDEAIRLAPALGGAYARRALAHALLGNDQQAEADVDRATELGFDVGSLKGAVEELKRER